MSSPADLVVHVIDDDPIVLDSIAFLLNSDGIKTAVYESAESFLSQSKTMCGGCLILDIRMPGMDGLALQRALADRDPGFVIVFITGHGDIEMAVRAMRNGAYDFIEKPFRDQELLDSVRSAMQLTCERESLALKVEHVQRRYAALSVRERQVMALVATGKANKVIAYELGVSQRTIELHRARVMEKMGARNLAQLVRQSVVLET